MTDITHYLDSMLTVLRRPWPFRVPIAAIVLVLAGATTPENLAGKRPLRHRWRLRHRYAADPPVCDLADAAGVADVGAVRDRVAVSALC